MISITARSLASGCTSRPPNPPEISADSTIVVAVSSPPISTFKAGSSRQLPLADG